MLSQTLKRLIARGAIFTLLFTQLAVAAFACPAINGAAGLVAAIAADDALHSAMPGCEMNSSGQDDRMSNANLCLQHCQSGEQSVQTLPHVAVPPLAAIPSLTVEEPTLVATDDAVLISTAWAVPVPLPPPLARFGALRI